MTKRIAPLFFALVLTGCPETTLVCGADMVRDGTGACIPDPGPDGGVVQPDAGRDGGTDADSGTDAGVVCEPACEGNTPFCIEVGDGDTDCVQCRDSGDCGSGICVDNECVQCQNHGDCDPATPICDGGSCRECVSAGGECAERDAATPVCSGGGCVECTAENESACADGICDVLSKTCTSIAPDSAGLCAPCVNDQQCGAGQLCIPQMFGTPPALVSHVCAWAVGAPDGAVACSDVPPYVRPDTRTSLGGGGDAPVTGTVCVFETSTCEAHRDFREQSCMSGMSLSTPVPDETCGAEGHADGFCARREGTVNRCTVECSADEDCPCVGACSSRYPCTAAGVCSLTAP